MIKKLNNVSFLRQFFLDSLFLSFFLSFFLLLFLLNCTCFMLLVIYDCSIANLAEEKNHGRFIQGSLPRK